MGLVGIGLVFSVLFNLGATEIPRCESVNITTLCSLNNDEGIEGPPKPWPAKINLSITLGGVISVDERKNFIKVLIFFYQSWEDSRITVNSNLSFHSTHSGDLEDIWYNEPFFYPTIRIERFKRVLSEKASYL